MHSSLSYGTNIKQTDGEIYYRIYAGLLDVINSRTINTIHTAPWWGYQKAERTIGAALRKSIIENGIYREEVFVSTRVGYVEVISVDKRKTSMLV